jgi:transposase
LASLFVGVDLGKRQNVAIGLDGDGAKRFTLRFPSLREGFEELERQIRASLGGRGPEACVVGMEATSSFWICLARFLEERGFAYRLVNPFTVKRVREGLNLDRTKTDHRDAAMIAELVRKGVVTKTRLMAEPYASLRRAYREHRHVQGILVGIRISIHQCLGRLFPEYALVFPDIFSGTSLGVLRLGLHAHEIAQMPWRRFEALVREHSRAKRLAVHQLQRLHTRAQCSIAVPEGAEAAKRQLVRLVATVEHLQGQLNAIEQEFALYLSQLPEAAHVLTMPGMGPILVAGLLGEIGDVRCYTSAKDIIKLAGCQPTAQESGEFIGATHPISKKGNSNLRTIAFLAALVGVQRNPVIAAYHQRLKTRSERPLKPMQALAATMNKVLTIVYTLARKRIDWDPSYDWHKEREHEFEAKVG